MPILVAFYLNRIHEPLVQFFSSLIPEAVRLGLLPDKDVDYRGMVHVRNVDTLIGSTCKHIHILRHRQSSQATDMMQGNQDNWNRCYILVTRGRESMTLWLEDEPWGVPSYGHEPYSATTRRGQWFNAIRDSDLPFEHLRGHTLPDCSLRLLTDAGITTADMKDVQSCVAMADQAWKNAPFSSNIVQVSDFFRVMNALLSKEMEAFTKTTQQQAYQGGSTLSFAVALVFVCCFR